jgi:hypothetical protein
MHFRRCKAGTIFFRMCPDFLWLQSKMIPYKYPSNLPMKQIVSLLIYSWTIAFSIYRLLPPCCRYIPHFLSWYLHSNYIHTKPHKHILASIICVLSCFWLLHVFTDTCQYFDFRYYNYTPVGLYIGHNDTWPIIWASYWLFTNTNGTLLPIPVHRHVCNKWDHTTRIRWLLSDERFARIRCSGISTN